MSLKDNIVKDWLPRYTGMALEDRQIGGLGVHLVKSLMDRSLYERHGTRNVVTLEKDLEPSSEPSE